MLSIIPIVILLSVWAYVITERINASVAIIVFFIFLINAVLISDKDQNVFRTRFEYKEIVIVTLREVRYADAVKKSTNSCFTSAKTLAGTFLPFIDWKKASVEKVNREWQEKIPLRYESN
jgi:hypothetical protein